MTKTKILKALSFFEKKSTPFFTVFSNQFICNYVKLSNYYFDKQVSFLISKDDQKLLEITIKSFPELVESKELNFFIDQYTKNCLDNERHSFLETKISLVLTEIFKENLKFSLFSQQIAQSRKNCVALYETESGVNGISYIKKIDPAFQNFPQRKMINEKKLNRSFLKFKKSLIFVCTLLTLRESHIKDMLSEIKKEKNENANPDFITLLLLDEALYRLIQENFAWLSEFYALSQLKETRNRVEKLKRFLSNQQKILTKQEKQFKRILELPFDD